MKQVLEVLLAGSIDYAGLFPPASLDMAEATESYARCLADPDSRILGRFVVPVVRLREFERAATAVFPRGARSKPWRLAALIGPDVTADVDLVSNFNYRHAGGSELGHAEIQALEMKVSTADEIEAAASMIPPLLKPFFELPVESDPAVLLEAIQRTSTYAKMRTGGVTSSAFPTVNDVVRFMLRCRDAEIPFKLTAGLHHPLRAEYRLTYADDAPRGTMYGYLNMFVAAVLAWSGAAESTVRAALLATSANDFHFSDESLEFEGNLVSTDRIRDARENFVMSFGSCSFREPVDDLAALSIS